MATVYKVEMEVVSEFVSLSDNEIETILKSTIEKWRSLKTGLGVRVTKIHSNKK